MSFLHLQQLDRYIGNECAAYTSDLVTQILVAAEIYPYLVYWMMITVMFFYYDIFFIAVNVVIFCDAVVNHLLNAAIQQPGPIGTDCWWQWEMPSSHSELLVVVGVLFKLLCVATDLRPNRHSMKYVLVFAFCIIYYRIYAGVNSPAQIYVGALVGLVNAAVGYFFIWYFVIPVMPVFKITGTLDRLGITNEYFKARYQEFVVDAAEK